MVSSLLIACYLNFGGVNLADWEKIIIGSILTTIIWLIATFLTPPDDDETLQKFVLKVNPGGPGWKKYSKDISSDPWPVPKGVLSMMLGCVFVYGMLIGVGQCIYGHIALGASVLVFGMISLFGLLKLWK